MDLHRTWTAAEILIDGLIIAAAVWLFQRLWEWMCRRVKAERVETKNLLLMPVVLLLCIVVDVPVTRILLIGRAMDKDKTAQAAIGLQDLNGKVPMFGLGPEIPWFHNIDYGMYWLAQAAVQGEPTAQACLGFALQDPAYGHTDLAPELLLRAVENPETDEYTRGHVLWALGRAFLTGESVDQDFGKARLCFEAGDSLENPLATFELGQMYRYGNGVGKDPAKADEYFKRAARLGCTERDGKPHLDMHKIHPPLFEPQDKH